MGLALYGQWNLFGEYGVHPPAPEGATATIAVLDSGFDSLTGGGWDFVSDAEVPHPSDALSVLAPHVLASR